MFQRQFSAFHKQAGYIIGNHKNKPTKILAGLLMLLFLLDTVSGNFLFLPVEEASAAYMTLDPNATLSIAGPYDTAVSGAGNWTAGGGNSYREFITIGQRYRIRQNGTVSRIRLYTATTANATGFYLKIWRKNGSNYDLVGTSNNLASGLVAGSTTNIDLSSPITGVQEGDYYGYRLETSAASNVFYARAGTSVTSYYVTGATPSATGYDWISQSSVSGTVLPIELYMQSPQFAFIGDSIMAGHPGHYSFLETTATTNISSTIESQFGALTSYTYQDMGIGSQTTTQIAARFTSDIVNLHPRVAVLEGGVNDIAGGSITKTTFLSNWTAMLDACQSNNITPIVIPILPWTNGSTAQMNTRDDWNASLIVLAHTYPAARVADMSSVVGQYRVSGPDGNLWDIKSSYNADGVHYNATGHGAIAQSLASYFQDFHFTITGSSAQNAGSLQTITITAYDGLGNPRTDYTGDKTITLSGANAIGANTPTFTDKDGTDVNFNSSGTLTFSEGVATTNVRLYKAETVPIGVSDGTYSTAGNVSYELVITVSALALDNFTIGAPSGIASQNAFTLSLRARDTYGNTTTNVVNATALSTDYGSIAASSIAAVQFQDDGIYSDSFTVSGIVEDASLVLSINNGNISQSVSMTAQVAYKSLPANPTLSMAGPYDVATAGAGNWRAGVGNTVREFATIGQQYRIRQNGTISRIRLYTVSTTSLTGFYLKIWRKNGSNYDLVGTSNNLASGLVAGSTTNIDLSSPITGVQEGDYYGYRIETGDGNLYNFYARTSVSGVISYYTNNTTPSNTEFNWAGQTAGNGVALPIELYMTSPQVVFIGDSIIAGHPGHYSFLETTATTDLASTIEAQFGALTYYTYQDMGIGGQTTTQIAARFASDVVALHPRMAIVDGGVNDIALGGANTKAAFLSNWTAILDACAANSIIPVVIPIMPWSNGSTVQMDSRDDWNGSLVALAQTYPEAIVVDMSSAVGQYRAGGPEGNLWDIKTVYNADGVHFNASGYGVIAQALAGVLQQSTDHLTLSGSISQDAGDAQTVTIRAYNNFGDIYTDYTGDRAITFSGASSIGSSAPTFTDKNGSDINFGSSGVVTFANGAATTDVKLYKAETVELEISDGTVNSGGNSSYDLDVVVSALAFSSFGIDAPFLVTSESPFSITLSAQDAYGNIVTDVTNPVVLSVDSGEMDLISVLAGQFQDDGIYTHEATISKIFDDRSVVLTVESGAVRKAKTFAVSGVTHFAIIPAKPDVSAIQAAADGGRGIDIAIIPPSITRIAISDTRDFKDTSWQTLDAETLKLLDDYSGTLYLKFATSGGAVSDIVAFASEDGSSAVVTLNDGDIVKTPESPDVYIIKYKNGKQYKRLILSPYVFKSYGHLNWSNLKIVSQSRLDRYPMSDLVYVAGDANIYILTPEGDRGRRSVLGAAQAFDSDSVYEINKADRDSYSLAK